MVRTKGLVLLLALIVIAAAGTGSASGSTSRPSANFTAKQIITRFRAETGKLRIRCSQCYVARKHVADLLELRDTPSHAMFNVNVYRPGLVPILTGANGRK